MGQEYRYLVKVRKDLHSNPQVLNNEPGHRYVPYRNKERYRYHQIDFRKMTQAREIAYVGVVYVPDKLKHI
jgi:hypothetical protein